MSTNSMMSFLQESHKKNLLALKTHCQAQKELLITKFTHQKMQQKKKDMAILKHMKLQRENELKAKKLHERKAEKTKKLLLKNAEKAKKVLHKKTEKAKKLLEKFQKNEEKRDKKQTREKTEKRKLNRGTKKNTGNISGNKSENVTENIIKENKKLEKDLFQSLIGNLELKKKELKSLHNTSFNNQVLKQYLNMICSNSGECLVFGRETEKINKLFDNFVDFRHLKSTRRVGNESVNGFVLCLEYQVSSYKVNALLKSSINRESDNLYYEYLVGVMFINQMNKVLPCFTETYHLFQHNSVKSKNLLKTDTSNLEKVTINDCDKKNVDTISDIKSCIEKSCVNGSNYAILVQYINDSISVKEYVQQNEKNDVYYIEELLCILYQLYTPLTYLKDEFTHYDFHYDNIQLYKLQPGKYVDIEYIDERSGKTTKVKSRYLPKIIDYGRAYFGNFGKKDRFTSKDISSLLCSTTVCAGTCGDGSGYNFFDPIENEHHMNSGKKNYSHDLRLVKMLLSISPALKTLMEDKPLIYSGEYGTKELSTDNRTKSIRNISDMQKYLQLYMDRAIFGIDLRDTSIGLLKVHLRKKIGEKNMEYIMA